jgi:hypothetical protein
MTDCTERQMAEPGRGVAGEGQESMSKEAQP